MTRKKILGFRVSNVKRAVRKSNTRKQDREHKIQCELITWFELKYPGKRFCASAGGMRTSMKQAVKMKRSGYRKGFPDLFIYEPCRGFHGLAIELKTDDGKVSQEQKDWISDLNARGFYATVCRELDEAMATVQAYFNENPLLKCD